MIEVWTKTYCSPFYEVSNLGNVRSIDRERPWRFGKTQMIKGKPLTSRIGVSDKKPQYIIFDLFIDGKKKTIRIHQLVYRSFVSAEPVNGMVIDHIDGDMYNNNLNNLQFITHSENCAKGRQHTGRKHKLPLNIKPGNNVNQDLRYRIIKKFKDKQKSFGTYRTIEEAVAKRDELIKNNWSLE
jgi:hypothetical protein